MSITFKELKAEIKKEVKLSIKSVSNKDWEIFLPFKTSASDIQKIFNICRKHLLVNWHIYIPEETEGDSKPDIKFWWDKDKDKF